MRCSSYKNVMNYLSYSLYIVHEFISGRKQEKKNVRADFKQPKELYSLSPWSQEK